VRIIRTVRVIRIVRVIRAVRIGFGFFQNNYGVNMIGHNYIFIQN